MKPRRGRIAARIEEQRDTDAEWLDWRNWTRFPFERWPDEALLSFVAGTPLEGLLDWDAPSASALRALILRETNCIVVVDDRGYRSRGGIALMRDYREEEDSTRKPPAVRMLRAEDWRTPPQRPGRPVGSVEAEREKAMARAEAAGQARGGGGGPFIASAEEARDRLNRQQREGR